MPETCSKDKWIPCAVHKPGALRRMLHMRKGDKIPDSLLKKVVGMNAGIGSAIMYRGHIIPITKLLQKRAILALTFRGF